MARFLVSGACPETAVKESRGSRAVRYPDYNFPQTYHRQSRSSLICLKDGGALTSPTATFISASEQQLLSVSVKEFIGELSLGGQLLNQARGVYPTATRVLYKRDVLIVTVLKTRLKPCLIPRFATSYPTVNLQAVVEHAHGHAPLVRWQAQLDTQTRQYPFDLADVKGLP